FIGHDVLEHLFFRNVRTASTDVDVERSEQRFAVQRDAEARKLLVANFVGRHEEQAQLVRSSLERNVVTELAASPVGKQERSRRAADESAVERPGAAASEVAIGRPTHAGIVDDLTTGVSGHEM